MFRWAILAIDHVINSWSVMWPCIENTALGVDRSRCLVNSTTSPLVSEKFEQYNIGYTCTVCVCESLKHVEESAFSSYISKSHVEKKIDKILSIYLSTNTAIPPHGDYVQVSGVLQTGRQCSES